MTQLSLCGASRWYETGGAPVLALDGVDLVVEAGEHMAVTGPSGSGKSTLLNLLGLLDTPSAGSYRVGDVDVARLSERDRTALRASVFGFVFQAFHLIPTLTAVENVDLGSLYRGGDHRVRRRRSLSALDRVGLSARSSAWPTTLSGGERQRVAIARAVAARPEVLLCDEPTGNLDSISAAAVLDLLEELTADGLTVVVVTHEPTVAARAGRRVHVSDGRLRQAE